MIGTTLSHYQIVDELGRGGMGIVYKAEDTKLDRTVAIKVLPSATLATEDDRARFYREAKAAAALHHPNIASVFEIDEAVPSDAPHDAQPSPFIAMEFIGGETLDARISKGPLKLKEAVLIATQIATGLEAAHEKKIVHRDIKSSNVMLTTKGDAKILDFGLAQTAQSTKLTRMGSTLGTAAYMSPEQAQGLEVDHRTDIWALGVVIYEMVSGVHPFESTYEQAIVYSILNANPEPLSAVRTGVSFELERIVDKCMTKDAALRYQHAADLIADLQAIDIRTSTRTSSPSIALPEARRFDWTKVWFALAAVLIFVAGVFVQRQLGGGVDKQVWSIPLDSGDWSSKLKLPTLALSPDGRAIIHVATVDGVSQLFLHRLDGSESRLIEDTEGASYPVFSPDNRWVAFRVGDQIKKGLLSGGLAIPIVTEGIADLPGMYWSDDDQIIFTPNWVDGVFRVSADGGVPEEILKQDPATGEGGFTFASLLPDGETVLCTIWGNGFDVAAINLRTGDRAILVRGGIHPRYLTSGHIVFAQGSNLMAMTFDTQTLEAGDPLPVIKNLITDYVGESAQYSISNSGSIAYLTGESEWDTDLVSYDFEGNSTVLIEDVGPTSQIRISPSGNRVLLNRLSRTRDSDVFVFDPVTDEISQRSFGAGYEGNAIWTPDGSELLYQSFGLGLSHVIKTGLSDTAVQDTLLTSIMAITPYDVSLDGVLYYTKLEPRTGVNIWSIPLDQSADSGIVMAADDDERWPTVSPDGELLAYTSNESGITEIYVRSLVNVTEGRVRVSAGGGSRPVWSSDGRFLYFRAGNDLLRTERTTGSQLSSTPERIFRNISATWDLKPSGEGIIMTSIQSDPGPILTINWIVQLQERLPSTR